MEKTGKEKFGPLTGPWGLARDVLNRLEGRVSAYMAQYIDGAEDPAPYVFKKDHTLRVCTQIRFLARSLGLSREIRNLSVAAALVHDLGRFPQFRRYNTFSDPLSRNHAALSVGEIRRLRLLEGLPRRTRQLLYRAVALHNRAALPEGLARELDRQARLLRDADKLDIFRVMTDLYTGPQNGHASFITHNYSDDGLIRPELIAEVTGWGRIAFSRVRSLNDLKLFQLSMIFDLNFPAAHAHVLAQGVVPAILRSMPGARMLEDLELSLIRYLENQASR